jgi:hypothetical protein
MRHKALVQPVHVLGTGRYAQRHSPIIIDFDLILFQLFILVYVYHHLFAAYHYTDGHVQRCRV